MEKNHIGNKIKKLVDEKNLTIQELAYKTGKSTTAIYDIFRKKDIHTEILTKISIVLGVPVTFWFEDNPELTKENLEFNNPVISDNTSKVLIDQLKIKDRQIDFLQQLVNDLRKK